MPLMGVRKPIPCPWCPGARYLAMVPLQPGICLDCAQRLVIELERRHPAWPLRDTRTATPTRATINTT